ncbi:MAG TPA: diguanylate cyclase [Phycisphaerae bacterium]|nr:diguanylate cyclase [Phycisphaerae bacterium]
MGDKPINVLLIEDSPGDARLIREFLAENGGGCFHLEWAERLEEGLRHLDAGQVDLVLLDLSLPQSAGLDTLAAVLAHAPRIPTIVLTGLDDEAVAVEAVRRGAQDYLVKGQLDSRLLVRAVRYAVERKQAEEALQQANLRLEELATTDELTGLANRRRFMAAIGLETERARRYGSDYALAMIDVDGFKAINDACGHVFGDRVLVEVARALEEGVRANDLVARYGGDEIMILMPNTNVEAAVDAVERLRKKVSARPIADNTLALEASFGAGISALDSKDRTAGPDLLIRQADEALYAAKHAGGNVTKTWNEITEDRTGEIADEAARVEDLRRKVAGLSLQAKEMVVQSLGGLVGALEARDTYTKGHSANVTRYAVAIAETLELDHEVIGVIRRAALIHDIGKIAVPDSILRKRGALDDHERRIMQGHVLAGVKIIDQMHFLERETPIVRHHHEWWKGGGYPDGISGEAVPLGARILAVADAFDAITADRVYRKARSVSDALRILVEESGRQFAPNVVDAMVKWVLEIGRELGKDGDLTVADLLQSKPVPVPA